MLRMRIPLLLILVCAPCVADGEVRAEVAGASITLPEGWTAKEAPPDQFVQARFQSPSGEEYVNAGTLLLPGYSLDEFAAMALVPLSGDPSKVVDRVAESTSIPKDDLVKFLERTALAWS